MMRLLSLLCVAALTSSTIFMSKAFADQTQQYGATYYQISEATITEIPDEDASAVTEYANSISTCGNIGLSSRTAITPGGGGTGAPGLPGVAAGLDPIGQAGVVVNEILNIGKSIWSVVEAGKPVVNVTSDVASALPRGISCWTDLGGWQIPQTHLYHVVYKNGYGNSVVDFVYRLVFTAGGNVNGVGKYITNATFMVANLKVEWGYTFNAAAQIAGVFNAGTTVNPIGAMQMNMKWTVDTAFMHSEATESYYVTGTSAVTALN